MGHSFVHRALREGARVHFTFYQNKSKAEDLIRAGATGHEVDLASMESLNRFIQEIRAAMSGLDVLIHNAAACRDHTVQNLSEEDWDYVMNVNLKAVYYLTKKLLPLLFKKKPAKVFMLTSRVALRGAYGTANYAAAKAGLIALAKSLAMELGRKKILVNAVNPGFMHSAMTVDLPRTAIERNIELNPLKEYSNPDEVAAFLSYLCGDEMNQVTGQVFHWEGRETIL